MLVEAVGRHQFNVIPLLGFIAFHPAFEGHHNAHVTRQSSCVTARGVPPAPPTWSCPKFLKKRKNLNLGGQGMGGAAGYRGVWGGAGYGYQLPGGSGWGMA